MVTLCRGNTQAGVPVRTTYASRLPESEANQIVARDAAQVAPISPESRWVANLAIVGGDTAMAATSSKCGDPPIRY